LNILLKAAFALFIRGSLREVGCLKDMNDTK
jgi:hypothetical protein